MAYPLTLAEATTIVESMVDQLYRAGDADVRKSLDPHLLVAYDMLEAGETGEACAYLRDEVITEALLDMDKRGDAPGGVSTDGMKQLVALAGLLHIAWIVTSGRIPLAG